MKVICLVLLAVLSAGAQDPAPAPAAADPSRAITVQPGTRILVQLINRISTRNASPGDRVYMHTADPVWVDSRLVIPTGSTVHGTITQVKRPGRVKGRGELYLRFDTLTLPNGVTRDFLGRVGAVEGSGSETLNKNEGKIQADTHRGQDAGTIATTSAAGTSIGAIAGSASGHSGLGTGIGAAGGAAAGVAAVLLTRGPDAILERGSTLDMILDRQLVYRADELHFPNNMSPIVIVPPSGNNANQSGARLPLPRGIPREN